MNRATSYNEDLSKRLRKPKYAREFILGLMEGPDSLTAEEAVKETIKIMGVKEFSKLADVTASNVSAFLRGRRQPKRKTLDTLLAPFRLKTKLALEEA